MLPLFPIGRVVTAVNQQQAILLFQIRKKLGIGGVIFTPDIDIPKWTEDEKSILSATASLITSSPMNLANHTFMRSVYRARAADFTQKFIDLSAKFNHTTRSRGIWFIQNDEVKFAPHRDPIAEAGFVHLHCEGAGMICLSPKGDKPVFAQSSNEEGTHFSPKEIGRLFSEGRIEPTELQPKQAIVFDHTMVHLSQQGKRFRVLSFDR